MTQWALVRFVLSREMSSALYVGAVSSKSWSQVLLTFQIYAFGWFRKI